ncbi:MAG: hypothetical protein U0X39_07265 [Bacteroidales bacterium]
MDFNTSIDIIIKDLRAAREILDDLKSRDGVPVFQIELAKAKCKGAEELLTILKELGPEAAGLPQSSNPVEKPKPSKHEQLIEIVHDDIPGELIEEEKVIASTEKPGSKNSDQHHDEPDVKVSHEKKTESSILADTFAQGSGSLNEQLGQSRKEGDISEVLKTIHIDNLKDAIGVNDKFLFIREIFGGNQGNYEEAITRLNGSTSLSDAIEVISGYSGLNEKNEAVNQLLEIVKRKLPQDV